jgi:hypothetical protein
MTQEPAPGIQRQDGISNPCLIPHHTLTVHVFDTHRLQGAEKINAS